MESKNIRTRQLPKPPNPRNRVIVVPPQDDKSQIVKLSNPRQKILIIPSMFQIKRVVNLPESGKKFLIIPSKQPLPLPSAPRNNIFSSLLNKSGSIHQLNSNHDQPSTSRVNFSMIKEEVEDPNKNGSDLDESNDNASDESQEKCHKCNKPAKIITRNMCDECYIGLLMDKTKEIRTNICISCGVKKLISIRGMCDNCYQRFLLHQPKVVNLRSCKGCKMTFVRLYNGFCLRCYESKKSEFSSEKNQLICLDCGVIRTNRRRKFCESCYQRRVRVIGPTDMRIKYKKCKSCGQPKETTEYGICQHCFELTHRQKYPHDKACRECGKDRPLYAHFKCNPCCQRLIYQPRYRALCKKRLVEKNDISKNKKSKIDEPAENTSNFEFQVKQELLDEFEEDGYPNYDQSDMGIRIKEEQYEEEEDIKPDINMLLKSVGIPINM